MINRSIHERYLDALLNGDRKASRSVIEEALQSGTPANSIYNEIIWPIMVEIERLFKEDRIDSTSEHMAVRINRTIVDQLQNKLPRKESKQKKIVVCCAPSEIQELGAQIMADLFESDGWEVKFPGGGLTNDDILSFVNNYGPDVLLLYGSEARQAPEIRRLIDTIKGVNAWPEMKIMVSGGLFNRAEGLWQEIGADLYAPTAQEAVETAIKPGIAEQVVEELESADRRTKRGRRVAKKVAAEV
jgi:methanogenic corrinoid protein MtbC1